MVIARVRIAADSWRQIEVWRPASRDEDVSTAWDQASAALAGFTIKELRCKGGTSYDARLVPVL